ncbi:MAG: zinc ribbon domain-containing protein [candidate division WOR-3 bacterium]|nr:zinc ribbon domain-containing protein [candidate division WOR-3 bacterium]
MEIHCPQCDASIRVERELILTKCPYCGVPLFYKKEGFLTKESIKPTHNSTVAVSLLKDLTGKVLKVRMEYFPFYRIKSENKTIFIPGKATNIYGMGSYVPKGDRIPLEIHLEEPEFSVDSALERAGVEKAEAIGLVYSPFFIGRDDDTVYYVDAAKGNILSNKLIQQKTSSRNQHPSALFGFSILAASSILFPNLFLKIILALLVAFGFWFYEREKESA